MLKEVYHR